MTDIQQVELFMPILQGIKYAPVVQSAYQPTLQGAPIGNTIFFSKVTDKLIGSPHILIVNGTKTTTQKVETTWQVGGLVKQDPNNIQITAGDLVAEAHLTILQSVPDFANVQAGILFITQIRNSYFKDEHDTYTESPSFDFTIVHNKTIITTTNTTSAIDVIIKGE
jgi:hypothetical protein